MSDVSMVGGRSKYTSISSEELLAPGELAKEHPQSISKATTTTTVGANGMVTIESEQTLPPGEPHSQAVSDAARFAGVHTTGVAAVVTPSTVFVRG